MPLVIPPTYANWTLTLTNSGGGLSGRNSVSIGMEHAAGLTQTDVGRIANLLRDGLTPRYDNTWLLGPTHVVFNNAGTMQVFDDTGTEAGTHVSIATTPPSVALVVSKNTGLLGPRHRGRMYMPGLDEGQIGEDGIVSGSERNAWQTSIDALFASLVADAAVNQLVLFHDVSTPNANTPDIITSFTVRTTVGNMRPRQRR